MLIECLLQFLKMLSNFCNTSQLFKFRIFSAIYTLAKQNASNYKRQPLNLSSNGVLQNLRSMLEKPKVFSNYEWQNIRQDIIKSQNHINQSNVDAIVLGFCNSGAHLETAKSYISYLNSEQIEPNIATLGRLMKIYYQKYKEGAVTESDKADILQIYDNIRNERQILDASTCENLIHGVIATEKWKEAFDLLDMIKFIDKPNANSYSIVIAKLFQNGDATQGFKLLEEMLSNDRFPKCDVYIEYFKHIQKNPTEFPQNLETLFKFLEKHNLLVSAKVINELVTILKPFGKAVSRTYLNRHGKCNYCRSSMQNIFLSDKEFNQLRTAFLDRVLVRKDVFQKSTPEEVAEFTKFVDKIKPVDCVIDGLNVAFSSGAHKPTIVCAKLVTSVVKYFVDNNKKVLVLGRKHMNQWPKEQMNYIRRKANLFLTNNLSQDDPFLLYAALQSGPTTDFFSRDLMRSHAHLLGSDLKPIFRRWQQKHQFSLLMAAENGKIVIKEPIRFCLNAQKVKKSWHIPFSEKYSAFPANHFEIPDSWLCISL